MIRMLSACIAALALGVVATSVTAQEPTPRPATVRLEATSDDAGARVGIVAENVVDLGAFGFAIAFEEPVEIARVDQGDLLAASGREVFCPDPVVEERRVEFRCVTLGDTPAAGSTGTGSLGSVLVAEPADGSSVSAALLSVELARPQGGSLPVETVGGTLRLFGGGDEPLWTVWAGLAVLAAAALAALGFVIARRRRAVQIDGQV